jgi:enoyl-CoA hydratase
VNGVVPAASLRDEARAMAQAWAANAPMAMRYAMEAVSHGLETSFAEGSFVEASLFGLTFATDDMREGTRAFLEKRKAEFQGR